jgi:predicted Ser/Thr protein kinase
MSWDIPIGTVIAGYRITGVLGRGGMSVVYEAEHLHLGRSVALKVLSANLSSDESFHERFTRESKMAAALEHPNIIPIYDAGEADGFLFIAMRYVEGTDLSVLIEESGQLGLGQAVFLLEQVAGALDQAHERGLVHRDVKPANILIARPSDRVYLTDFGVGKQSSTNRLTKTGYFLGTFAYAAPEQIEGKPVDGRTDVYALGCVLYECLSGDPPFNATTEAAIIHAHLVEPPPRLTDRRPDLPSAINGVIATAMAKAMEDRYPTCGELLRALRSAIMGTTAGDIRGASGSIAVPETIMSPAGAPAVETPPAAAAEPSGPATGPPTAFPAEPEARPAPEQEPAPPLRSESPREPRTIALSGRRLVAAAAALVALIAAAVILAVVMTGGGNKTAATVSTATTVPTTGPATTTGTGTPAKVGLAGVVPADIFKYCKKGATAPGAAETAVCAPRPGTGGGYHPDSWTLSIFASAAALHRAYDRLRRENDIGRNLGQCSGVAWGGEGAWEHGPGKPGGRRFCYFAGNVAVIVWTHEKLGQASHIDTLGTARAGGSDHSNLFGWFRFWHHRLGKCAQPDCVARLK